MRRASRPRRRRRWRRGGGTRWSPAGVRTCGRGLTRCPRSGGTCRTSWACRNAYWRPCRKGRPRSGTWPGRLRCRRSPGRMRCTCCGAGGWGSTCPARSATRRRCGWQGNRLMTGQAGLLELSAGSALLLGGREWTVASVEPQYGRVLLRSGGEEQRRSIRWLAHHPDCRPVLDDDAAVPARPPGSRLALGDLTDYQREVVRLRVAHLLEAETGFRSGDPLHPEPGEPRPAYDPRATMLGQRRAGQGRRAGRARRRGSGAARPGTGKRADAEAHGGRLEGQGPGRVHRRAVAPAAGRASQHHRGGAGGDLRGPEGDQGPVQDQHEGQARPGRPVRRREVRGGCPGPGLLDAEEGLAGMVRAGRHPSPL